MKHYMTDPLIRYFDFEAVKNSIKKLMTKTF